jgi:predicted GIY-YIG superfamily endonuclease
VTESKDNCLVTTTTTELMDTTIDLCSSDTTIDLCSSDDDSVICVEPFGLEAEKLGGEESEEQELEEQKEETGGSVDARAHVSPSKKRPAKTLPRGPKSPTKQRNRRKDWAAVVDDGTRSFVYILTNDKGEAYTGFSKDPQHRLLGHNAGRTPSTRRSIPWRIAEIFGPFSKTAASRFESLVKNARGPGVPPKRAAARLALGLD